MAEQHWQNYIPLPDAMTFTRAKLMAAVMRSLQINSDHLHGTRTRMLVSDVDLWVTVAAGGPNTSATYHVTVGENVERLIGTVIWVSKTQSPGLTNGMLAQFYTERGGAAVAAGLDPITSDSVTDRMDVGDARRESVWDHLQVYDHRLGENFPFVGRQLSGGAGGFIPWEPDLSTSNEQRIEVQTQLTANSPAAVQLWGVFIWEVVPQH